MQIQLKLKGDDTAATNTKDGPSTAADAATFTSKPTATLASPSGPKAAAKVWNSMPTPADEHSRAPHPSASAAAAAGGGGLGGAVAAGGGVPVHTVRTLYEPPSIKPGHSCEGGKRSRRGSREWRGQTADSKQGGRGSSSGQAEQGYVGRRMASPVCPSSRRAWHDHSRVHLDPTPPPPSPPSAPPSSTTTPPTSTSRPTATRKEALFGQRIWSDDVDADKSTTTPAPSSTSSCSSTSSSPPPSPPLRPAASP